MEVAHRWLGTDLVSEQLRNLASMLALGAAAEVTGDGRHVLRIVESARGEHLRQHM